MKSALFLVALLAAICLICAEQDYEENKQSESQEKFKNAFNKCIKELHMNKKRAIQRMKEHKKIESRRRKCLAACVFEKLGLMKGSSIDWEAVKATNSQKYKDQELLKKANQLTDTCSYAVPQENEDPCEVAGAAINCWIEESKKMNLPEKEYNFLE